MHRKKNNITIDIAVKNVQDVFQQFSQHPFGNRALSKEFEEYICSSIKNYNLKDDLSLVVYVPSIFNESDVIKSAVRTHFKLKAKETSLYLKYQFKQWIINMIIGTLFLVLCLILVEILETFSYINVVKIIKESLLIIGWVALWEPLTFILFGWRTIKRDKLFYTKLSNISISILKW